MHASTLDSLCRRMAPCFSYLSFLHHSSLKVAHHHHLTLAPPYPLRLFLSLLIVSTRTFSGVGLWLCLVTITPRPWPLSPWNGLNTTAHAFRSSWGHDATGLVACLDEEHTHLSSVPPEHGIFLSTPMNARTNTMIYEGDFMDGSIDRIYRGGFCACVRCYHQKSLTITPTFLRSY